MPDFKNSIPESDDLSKMGIKISKEFSEIEGRQPRILVANFSEITNFASNNLSIVLADMGFDVDLAPKLDGMKSLVNQCIENDADILLICHNLLDIELSQLEEQLVLVNFNGILSLYFKDEDMTTSLVSKLKNWQLYDQTYNEESIAFDLLRSLLHPNE